MPAILREQDQEYLRQRFATELENPVKLVHFTESSTLTKLVIPGRDTCLYCNETRQLMEDIAGLSDKLSLEIHEYKAGSPEAMAYGVTRVPLTILEGTNQGRLRYVGIPAGRELPSFIETLIDVSRNLIELSEETRAALDTLQDPIHIQVFFTPT